MPFRMPLPEAVFQFPFGKEPLFDSIAPSLKRPFKPYGINNVNACAVYHGFTPPAFSSPLPQGRPLRRPRLCFTSSPYQRNHLSYSLFYPCIDASGDDGKPYSELLYFSNPCHLFYVVVIESVPRVDLKVEPL